MPSNADSDTTTLGVLGVQETLSTISVAGNYQFKIDSANLVADEEIIIEVFDKILTGGTSRLTDLGGTVNAQSSDIQLAIPLSVVFEMVVKATQNNGTLRAFDWAVVDMAP